MKLKKIKLMNSLLPGLSSIVKRTGMSTDTKNSSQELTLTKLDLSNLN